MLINLLSHGKRKFQFLRFLSFSSSYCQLAIINGIQILVFLISNQRCQVRNYEFVLNLYFFIYFVIFITFYLFIYFCLHFLFSPLIYTALHFRFFLNVISLKSAKKLNFLLNFRCRNQIFGSTHFHWLSIGHDLCLWKVSVAADYSDSVPDSSSYRTNRGYHPLEELKVCKKTRETKLSAAEIARTTVEVHVQWLDMFQLFCL